MKNGKQNIRAALLESGKKEFLEHGFDKASLRTICQNAGVTTGAFYSHFKKKEDLFSALVEDDLRLYNQMYDGLMDRIIDQKSTQLDSEALLMSFIMDHRDLFKLLFDCAQGTKYENFKADLLVKFNDTYQDFFDAYNPGAVDPAVTNTILRMKFEQYCAMIYSDYSRDEVMRITRRIRDFTRAGFEALLNTSFEGPG